jgi:3-hydroxyacyl-CoA dehydrogenase
VAGSYRGPDEIGRVAIVGTGLIGSGWAAAFLAHGCELSVYDPAPQAEEKLSAHIARAWPALRELGLAIASAPPPFQVSETLEEAVGAADFVQENTPERVELKRKLFAQIDAVTPADVLIASSTSGMPITELQQDCRQPERCVLGHPFNPVHLMPLVEIGGGRLTDPAAIETAQAVYVAMGKEPVRLHREIVGHIANRLTSAMFREAVSLVAQGYATVADIDRAIRFGPGPKWAIQGQFTTFHTSGGEGGLSHFLDHFAPGIMARWATMQTPDLADVALQAKLAEQIGEASNHRPVAEIAQAQDSRLLDLLKVLRSERA